MRPGRTQTGMSSYWSPYIFFMHLHGTSLKMNSDRPDLDTRYFRTGLRLYHSRVTRKRISDRVHK